MDRTKVFISYSHKDEEWMKQLRKQLDVLERQQLLDVWVDTELKAGEDWHSRLHSEMLAARVAVLLISADFLTSDFVLDEEVPKLLQAHKKGGMSIFPVLVWPCPWKRVNWLARLQVRPHGARPIAGGSEFEIRQDFSAIADEVAELAENAV